MNLPADLLQIAHLIRLCDEDAQTSSDLPTDLRQELTLLSQRASALAETIAAAIAPSTRLGVELDVRSSELEPLTSVSALDQR